MRRRIAQQRLRDPAGHRALEIAHHHAAQHQRPAVRRGQSRRPVEERPHDLASHAAGAEHPTRSGCALIDGRRDGTSRGW